MPATALLKFTQGATVGADGQALIGVLTTPVSLSNVNNAAVASWQIDLVYADPASAVIPATPYAFSDNSSVPAASFVPDVGRSFRWVLKVWSVVGRVGQPDDVDIRVFSVRAANGAVIPPSQVWPLPLPDPRSGDVRAKPNELNFGGQLEGWHGNGTDGLPGTALTRVPPPLGAPGTVLGSSGGEQAWIPGGISVIGTPVAGYVPKWDGTQAVWSGADAYSITAFAAATPVVEVGATATTPAFTAAHNRTPTSLALTNGDNVENKNVVGTPTGFSSSQNYTKTANNAAVTFTLTGSDGISPDARTASISWRPRVYHGVGAAGGNNEAFIEALASSALQSSRATSYTDNATGANKLYWAAPASYGTPTFTVGGFAGGFSLVSNTISVTNSFGVTQNYQLWESDVAGLGSTAVVVS